MGNDQKNCARKECDAQIVDDKLVIAISISTLAHAFRHSEYFYYSSEFGPQLKITDEAIFAKSVARALNSEQEDGSTPVTRMLDKAFECVCEQGEDGVQYA